MLDVAFGGQGSYSLPLGVAIATLLDTLESDGALRLWIMDLGLSPETRERVERAIAAKARCSVELHWIAVKSSAVPAIATSGHLSRATYLRLLLPDYLPAYVQRVVYLDADILVKRSVASLASVRVDGVAVAAVQDYAVEVVSGPRSPIVAFCEGAERRYFNGGVLIMNLELWRNTELSARLLRFATTHAPLRYADQDALNVLIDHWLELDLTWNVQTRLFELEKSRASEFTQRVLPKREHVANQARILHFTEPSKPWRPKDRHRFEQQWREALLQSGCLTDREARGWRIRHSAQRAAAQGQGGAGRTLRALGLRR